MLAWVFSVPQKARALEESASNEMAPPVLSSGPVGDPEGSRLRMLVVRSVMLGGASRGVAVLSKSWRTASDAVESILKRDSGNSICFAGPRRFRGLFGLVISMRDDEHRHKICLRPYCVSVNAGAPGAALIVPAMPVALPKFIGIDRARPGARARPNQRAFLPVRYTANGGPGCGRSRHSKFVAMLLPESPAMAAMPPCLRRRDWPRRKK